MWLVVGERSDLLVKRGAQQVQRLWPNTRLHVLAGCNHLPMRERPDEFNALLQQFLQEVDAQVAARQLHVGQVP